MKEQIILIKNIVFKGEGNLIVNLENTDKNTGTFTIKVNETSAINDKAGKNKNENNQSQDKYPDRLTTEKAVVDFVNSKILDNTSNINLTLTDSSNKDKQLNLATAKLKLLGDNLVDVIIEDGENSKDKKISVKLNDTTKTKIDSIGTGIIDSTNNNTVTGKTVKAYVDGKT